MYKKLRNVPVCFTSVESRSKNVIYDISKDDVVYNTFE